MDWIRFRKLIMEFFRYVIVGGISFIIDFLTLILLYEYIMPTSALSLYISNVGGFFAGVISNYSLSVKFVFIEAREHEIGKSNYDKIKFAIIGILGLLINELGMYIGVDKMIIDYKIIKILMAGIVMIWNYFVRKKFVFSIKNEF
jgi:putative flippase GtrA